MSKAIFTPAIGEQFNSTWGRGLVLNGKDLKWFTEQSHFQIDASLICCYYPLLTEGIIDYRKKIGYPKNKILITDSAGFQMATFKQKGEQCKINPIDSLRWQEANADVAMNLDIPPTLGDIPTHEEFISALKQSIENFTLFEKERKNYDMKLLNVIHGESLPYLKLWWDGVKHFKFDGIAIGVKPPFNPMLQAQAFLYLWEQGEFKKESCKWIHFFGTSGKHVVPTLVYLANKINIPVSYDSSSYNIGSIYRTYYSPLDFGCHLSFGDKFQILNPNIMQLPCKCPVCTTITDISILNTGEIYAGTLISLHNLYQYYYFNDILNSLVLQKDKFIEYLQKINISEKTLKSIDYIDFAMKEGLEAANHKFANDLLPQDLNITKQSSIFDY